MIEIELRENERYFDDFYSSPDKRILLIEKESWKPKFAKEKLIRKLKGKMKEQNLFRID